MPLVKLLASCVLTVLTARLVVPTQQIAQLVSTVRKANQLVSRTPVLLAHTALN